MSLPDLLAVPDLLTSLPMDFGDINPSQPPGTDRLSDVMGWVKWVALAICVIGIMVGGALMAIQSRRGQGGEHAGTIGMALGGVIIISAAGALVGFLMS